jgi:type I restriction enzyme R subunit
MNISADPDLPARELPLSKGHADYLLYAAAKAIGVVQAKQEGHPLTGIETQSAKYLDGLPSTLPNS